MKVNKYMTIIIFIFLFLTSVNSDGFIKGMYYAFKAHEEVIRILFTGRMNVLVDKIERELINQYPQFRDAPEKEIVLSFIIRGATQVLSEPKYDEVILLDTLSKIISSIILLIL